MNIAVVGGAGYIGSHVVLAVQDAGHTAIIFDNLSKGSQANIDATGASFFEGDIRSKEDCKRFFATHDIDAVIHLAALKSVGESMEDPGLYMDNNISGTITLTNAMLDAGVDTMIFSSSAAVYGQPESVPVQEDDPTIPTSVYGFTKLECERILSWYAKTADLKLVNLRYFNVVGFDPKGRLMNAEPEATTIFPLLFETASGAREEFVILGDDYDTPDGTGVRDYIHVSDLADAHVMALDAASDTPLTLNLATGHGYSVKECVAAVKNATTDFRVRVGPRRPGDPATSYADPSRANDILGWKASRSDLPTIVKTMKKVYGPGDSL